MTEEHRRKISEGSRGKKMSEEAKFKMSISAKARKRNPWSLEVKKKISITLKIRNNPNFSEDTIEYKIDTSSVEYLHFKKCVLRRDHYTCQKCSSKKNLEVHHKKPKALFPELLCVIENGITLCDKCHCKVDKIRARFGVRKIRLKENMHIEAYK
jgi:5-methylcytosine-specific restriction endonuclease McrA